jgi:hypothetical protein
MMPNFERCISFEIDVIRLSSMNVLLNYIAYNSARQHQSVKLRILHERKQQFVMSESCQTSTSSIIEEATVQVKEWLAISFLHISLRIYRFTEFNYLFRV